MSQPEENCKDQYTINPDGKKKVILSIDGGGMRGAITIGMLAELQEQYEKVHGANTWQNKNFFQMIAGTSTGAIIALALTVGFTPLEIKNLIYKDLLPRMFRSSKPKWWANFTSGFINMGLKNDTMRDFVARILSNGLRFAYSTKVIEDELLRLLREKGVRYMRDLTAPEYPILLITTKDTWIGETSFLVTAGKGKKNAMNWPLAGAVTCSGSAPIFFPPVMSRFVDGGVGIVNNPCLAAAIEAVEYIGGFDPELAQVDENEAAWFSENEVNFWHGFKDNLIMVSLGAGYSPSVLDAEKVDNNKAYDWLGYVITEGMDDSSLDQVFKTRAIYGKAPKTEDETASPIDFRRYNPLMTTKNLKENLDISLQGRGVKPEQLGLDSFAEEAVELMFEIGHSYARNICWSQENVMPWHTKGGHKLPGAMAKENQIPAPDFSPYPW